MNVLPKVRLTVARPGPLTESIGMIGAPGAGALSKVPYGVTTMFCWRAEFRAVAAVCPSMNLAASADALHLLSNRLYELTS